MLDQIKQQFALDGADPNQYSPLSLAFIGDSIYGAVIKTMVILEGNCSANRLDAKAVTHIRATSQAKAIDHLIENDLLTEEELAIYKRGRNAKSVTTAKNAPVGDYRKATGLEAVIGYVYLKGDMERVIAIIRECVDSAKGVKRDGSF